MALEIPIHKTTHKPVNVPTTAPQLFIDTGTRRRLIITYKDEASDKRGKHVYLSGRWEINREGEEGPFGDIEDAIIP